MIISTPAYARQRLRRSIAAFVHYPAPDFTGPRRPRRRYVPRCPESVYPSPYPDPCPVVVAPLVGALASHLNGYLRPTTNAGMRPPDAPMKGKNMTHGPGCSLGVPLGIARPHQTLVIRLLTYSMSRAGRLRGWLERTRGPLPWSRYSRTPKTAARGASPEWCPRR